MLFIVWRFHAVLARPGPRPGVRACVCVCVSVCVYMCARARVCDQVSVFAGVRARAGVGALGERPENTLVCTERPFAAGEFVFFHFCSTFSQAASCLVSDHFKQQKQQPKKKKKKERKEKKIYFPSPGSTAPRASPPALPRGSFSLPRVRARLWGGWGLRVAWGSRGFQGHCSLGCISISQMGGGAAKAAARRQSRLPLGPFTRCSALAVGREIDKPRRPGVTFSVRCWGAFRIAAGRAQGPGSGPRREGGALLGASRAQSLDLEQTFSLRSTASVCPLCAQGLLRGPQQNDWGCPRPRPCGWGRL